MALLDLKYYNITFIDPGGSSSIESVLAFIFCLINEIRKIHRNLSFDGSQILWNIAL